MISPYGAFIIAVIFGCGCVAVSYANDFLNYLVKSAMPAKKEKKVKKNNDHAFLTGLMGVIIIGVMLYAAYCLASFLIGVFGVVIGLIIFLAIIG